MKKWRKILTARVNLKCLFLTKFIHVEGLGHCLSANLSPQPVFAENNFSDVWFPFGEFPTWTPSGTPFRFTFIHQGSISDLCSFDLFPLSYRVSHHTGDGLHTSWAMHPGMPLLCYPLRRETAHPPSKCLYFRRKDVIHYTSYLAWLVNWQTHLIQQSDWDYKCSSVLRSDTMVSLSAMMCLGWLISCLYSGSNYCWKADTSTLLMLMGLVAGTCFLGVWFCQPRVVEN